jgi:PadR family transcriptional regulator, regulatory protein PadR
MRGDVLKGHLELLLLAAVSSEPGHGYAVIERLRGRSHGAFDFAEGTIYPALHRLEAVGLLESRWSRVGGRRRRVYALTRRGRAVLGEREDEWRRFRGAVDLVVAGA